MRNGGYLDLTIQKSSACNLTFANRTFFIGNFFHPYCNINMNFALAFYFAIQFSVI